MGATHENSNFWFKGIPSKFAYNVQLYVHFPLLSFFTHKMLFSTLSRSPLYSSSSVLVLSPSLHIAANLIPRSLVDKADGIAAISWYQVKGTIAYLCQFLFPFQTLSIVFPVNGNFTAGQ